MTGVPDPEIGKAQAQVALAKARLLDTAQELQRRLKPDELVRGAMEGVREKSAEFAEDAVAAMRARPAASAGAMAAVIGLLFRKPLTGLVRRWFSHRNESAAP
jgi:hypothetical protein